MTEVPGCNLESIQLDLYSFDYNRPTFAAALLCRLHFARLAANCVESSATLTASFPKRLGCYTRAPLLLVLRLLQPMHAALRWVVS